MSYLNHKGIIHHLLEAGVTTTAAKGAECMQFELQASGGHNTIGNSKAAAVVGMGAGKVRACRAGIKYRLFIAGGGTLKVRTLL